jgi:hypothetical protein
VAAALLVLGACGSGDRSTGMRGRTCRGGETLACACPDGSESTRPCVGGRPGLCACGAASAADGGGFGNSTLDGSLDLIDASAMSSSDARAIEADTTCGEQQSQAVIAEERPVDVIFIIDNSGSMSSEIVAVERNINQNFAQIIEQSGADYRVIMITDHGASSLEVCIDQPLAAAPCSDSTLPTGTTLGAPANSPRFFHYDINVQSTDSVCLMLQHYLVDPVLGPFPQTGAPASPTGWNEWLRPDALKVFVEITDDRLSCSATASNPAWSFAGTGDTLSAATRLARSVYSAIQSLSAEQFGTPAEPKFIWHSIVGIGDNDPIELPYTHFDPPKLDAGTTCTSAVNPGSAYQMLSISTAGLRYPVCAADTGHGYDGVFRAIAHEVVRGARVECSFNVPTPPPGKFIDYESVIVKYTPGDGSAEETLGPVREARCDDKSFYFGDREIKLCGAACDRVRADELAKVSVVFGCGPETVLDPDAF